MQEVNVLTPLLDFVSQLKGTIEEDLLALRAYLGNKDIKVRAENPAGGKQRVILFAERRNITPLSKACGGLVFEYPGWEVLARGPPLISISGGTKNLAKNLEQYKIYKIQDGTVVTLYYYGGWQMASMHGIDVSSYQWMGDITYAQALAKIMAIEGWSLDSLDTTLQYTIGFRHHHFHPLRKDPEASWLIQVSRGATIIANGESPMHVAGLKWQTPVQIPRFETNGRKTNNLAWMRSENETALSNYVSSNGEEIHYGYLLRHPTKEDFLLESSLHTFVRRTIYDLPRHGLTAANRIDYIIVRAYLSYKHRYDFRIVFPQFENRIKSIDGIFDKLHREVMDRLKCSDVIAKAPGSFEEHVDMVAAMLVKDINSFTAVNVMNADGSEIVRDFIIDPKYLDNYHALCSHHG